ncbi:MAG: hypothetical protein K2H09_03475 [Treponemataceae bacterium]|nr:hypothetical protein [Treponemataceae bacterium]
MNKLNAKTRATEVDALSDALVRLYKADAGVADDAFLKTVMEDVDLLSAHLTTAIKQDKVPGSLMDADSARVERAAAGAQGESASSLKKLLVGVINDKLVPYLSAMALANASVYSRFAAKAEEEISRANETVARRGK